MSMQMKLGHTLKMQLTQSLTMTPQLVQAIRLLQLLKPKLMEEVQNELDVGLVLADDAVDPERAALSEETTGRLNDDALEGQARAEREVTDLDAREQERQVRDVDWEQLFENRQMGQAGSGSRGGGEELPSLEQTLTPVHTLEEHLMWQVQMSDFVENERDFATLIIGNLDDRGYLDLTGRIDQGNPDEKAPVGPALTIEELAREAGLNPEDAPEVLSMIQHFDPLGVAARDLRECLRIQAEEYGYDDVELAIIDHYLPHVERRNFPAIARGLKIPLEDVVEAVQQIQRLESIPARNFLVVDDRTIAITPDVYIVKEGERYVVTDNDRGEPRLYINKILTQKLLDDPKTEKLARERLKNAEWLLRAIEQRRRTIIRVTECIVEKQRDFLEEGVSKLRPMILSDVAEAVELHESTISRVTSNKYVQTPQGLFELKYFFNSSIRRVAEEDIASESVKQAIKKLIDDENKDTPQSDQALVKLLEDQHGIQIARRTVAKYREMLGILASSKRKKMY